MGGVGVPTEYLVAPVLNWTGMGCGNTTKLIFFDSLLQEVCILSPPRPVQFKTGATRYSVGTPHPHKLSEAKEGLYWITHPCPWLNNSAEIVHSPSFKERKMSKI